jgi:hypothetical protein
MVEQIAVGGVDLDTVEIGQLCVPGGAPILPHKVGNFLDIERARPHERHKLALAALVLDEGLALRDDGGGRDRKHVVGLEGEMRDAPDCQSWLKINPPDSCTAFVTPRHASICSRLWMPGVQA